MAQEKVHFKVLRTMIELSGVGLGVARVKLYKTELLQNNELI